MSYHWQGDGTDDRGLTPSISFNRVEVVFEYTGNFPPGQQRIWSLPLGANFLMLENGQMVFSGGVSSAYIDDTLITNRADFRPYENQKVKVVTNLSGVNTHTVHIFCNNGNTAFFPGNLFSIKFFNGASLSASYDMSTQSFDDQSGNEKHATVFGGTWVEDSEGGGTEPEPITHVLSLSDSITTSDAISKRLSVMVADTIATSEVDSESVNKSVYDSISSTDSITHTQGKAVNLSDSIAILDSITKSLARSISDNVDLADTEDEAVLKSLVDSITLSDSISTFGGKSILLTDSISVTDSISATKQLSRFFTESVGLSDTFAKRSTQSIKLYDVIVTDDSIDVFNPDAPELIGVIHLQGKRELYVYLEGKRDLVVHLQGKRELTIHLKGGLNMISNQNFSMVSGDTKTIVININENLVGATVIWSMKKRGAPTVTLIKQGSIVDGKIHIVLDKADTEELSGLFVHECEVTDQSGNVSTVTSGSVNILADMI